MGGFCQYLSAGEVMATGEVGRPSIQGTAGGQALELDVVGRGLGVMLWRRRGGLVVGRHGLMMMQLGGEVSWLWC